MVAATTAGCETASCPARARPAASRLRHVDGRWLRADHAGRVRGNDPSPPRGGDGKRWTFASSRQWLLAGKGGAQVSPGLCVGCSCRQHRGSVEESVVRRHFFPQGSSGCGPARVRVVSSSASRAQGGIRRSKLVTNHRATTSSTCVAERPVVRRLWAFRADTPRGYKAITRTNHSRNRGIAALRSRCKSRFPSRDLLNRSRTRRFVPHGRRESQANLHAPRPIPRAAWPALSRPTARRLGRTAPAGGRSPSPRPHRRA
jgi:hypothetical protein